MKATHVDELLAASNLGLRHTLPAASGCEDIHLLTRGTPGANTVGRDHGAMHVNLRLRLHVDIADRLGRGYDLVLCLMRRNWDLHRLNLHRLHVGLVARCRGRDWVVGNDGLPATVVRMRDSRNGSQAAEYGHETGGNELFHNQYPSTNQWVQGASLG